MGCEVGRLAGAWEMLIGCIWICWGIEFCRCMRCSGGAAEAAAWASTAISWGGGGLDISSCAGMPW